MKIAGFQRTTLLDYPGKVASVIFLDRCNFKCGFCHNPELVTDIDYSTFIEDKDVFEMLEARKYLVDAVVITGGEPCMNSGLYDLIVELKNRGFFVKLDTNGAFPHILDNMIKEKLLDFVAMDVKTSLTEEAYRKVTGTHVDISRILESIQLIMKSGIDYEFRCTVIPGLVSINDLEDMAISLKGAKKFCIQQFVNEGKLIDEKLRNSKRYSPDELRDIKSSIKKCYKEVEIRGI